VIDAPAAERDVLDVTKVPVIYVSVFRRYEGTCSAFRFTVAQSRLDLAFTDISPACRCQAKRHSDKAAARARGRYGQVAHRAHEAVPAGTPLAGHRRSHGHRHLDYNLR